VHRDINEVREYYVKLRELVLRHSGGWDDADARAKAEGLCGAGMAALDDADCRDSLRVVRAQAAELFSRERHLKWGRKDMTGADYLRLQMLVTLEALNTRLFCIQTLRNRASFQQPAQDLPPALKY
jgi:hypothetical protein